MTPPHLVFRSFVLNFLQRYWRGVEVGPAGPSAPGSTRGRLAAAALAAALACTVCPYTYKRTHVKIVSANQTNLSAPGRKRAAHQPAGHKAG